MRQPLRERYRKAIPTIIENASPLQKEIFSALAEAGKIGISATQLALLLGQKDKIVINRAFGMLGKALWSAVSSHPDGLRPAEFEWWTMLATGQYEGGEFVWSLRPDVLAAVAVERSTSQRTSVPQRMFMEGRRVSTTTDFYERSSIARRLCLKAHGHACTVCGVLLADVYGPIADELIHVHHLKPLNANGREHLVDPVRDLRPVCPNCHAAIHVTSETRSIDEMRALLKPKTLRTRTRPKELG